MSRVRRPISDPPAETRRHWTPACRVTVSQLALSSVRCPASRTTVSLTQMSSQIPQWLVLLYVRERNFFYLMTYSTHFIYGYMASDMWLRTILIVRKENCCRHIGYSYRLTARVLLYAPSHRQDNTYHGLCYTSRGALAGTRNSSMGP